MATAVEAQGVSNENEVSMCGDEMLEDTYACGKIHATRFFVIILSLLAAVAASLWLLAFSPLRPGLRGKLCHFGALFTGSSLFCNFLVMCIAASIKAPAPMSQNGAGFAFVAITFLFISCATVLAALAGTTYPQVLGVTSAPKVVRVDGEISESADKTSCTVQPKDEHVSSKSTASDCANNGLSKGENLPVSRPESLTENPTLLESRPVSRMDGNNDAHAKDSTICQASPVKESIMGLTPNVPQLVDEDTHMAAEERPNTSATKATPTFWFCCATV